MRHLSAVLRLETVGSRGALRSCLPGLSSSVSEGFTHISDNPLSLCRCTAGRMFRLCFQAAGVLWFVSGCLGGASRLYTEDDPLVILGSSSLKPTISNSSSAWLVQFYSSWCGHCIHYSSTWKVLAQDVKGTAAESHMFPSGVVRSPSQSLLKRVFLKLGLSSETMKILGIFGVPFDFVRWLRLFGLN